MTHDCYQANYEWFAPSWLMQISPLLRATSGHKKFTRSSASVTFCHIEASTELPACPRFPQIEGELVTLCQSILVRDLESLGDPFVADFATRKRWNSVSGERGAG